ncbi:MAG TPA: lipoate--protein ligase family protein, partial [Methylomirabilota bacterium]|nr:lipoate--protein ligase family protein [Methylomirabilota bacterium]
MKYLELTFADPARNLACDEALLELCEQKEAEGILRIWEPQTYFVVLGYSNKLATEVNVEACAERGMPVLRRFSGGGTVL